MNGREIFNASLRGERTSRTPVFLFDLSLGMDVLGVPTTDLYSGGFNGKLGGKCIVALQKHLKNDALAGSYQSIDITAFGGKFAYPEYGIPYIAKPAVSEIDDLYRYSPSDIREHMQGSLDSFTTVRSGAPDVGLMMNIPAPLSTAMVLRGLQTFLMDLYLEPEFSKDMISFAGDVSKNSIDVIAGNADIDGVLLTAAYDNLDMIGPDAMKEFSFPGLRASEKFIHGLGLPVMFHPHGALTSDDAATTVLDEMLDMGFDCLYYGETIDAAKIKEHADGKCALCGGIDTFTTIYLGPDERVRSDVDRYLDHFTEYSGYIFSPSCSVDRGLPLRRMEKMMRTVRGH